MTQLDSEITRQADLEFLDKIREDTRQQTDEANRREDDENLKASWAV